MLKTKYLALLSTLVAAGVGLYLLFNVDSSTTEVKFTTESPQTSQPIGSLTETTSKPTVQVQPAATGQDPFKKFLDEKKSNNLNSSVKADNSQAIPVQTGKDPFKEFLDKQKQNSKDQVVSPFGKN
jgi:hypothetical protein